ncbi:MAG TPA: energy transducer TonB [Terracidiphilus sp.]|jgi:protein TonB
MSVNNGAANRKSSALWLWLAAAAVAIVVLLAVGILLIIPLIYPAQLPQDNMATILTAPPPPPPPPPPPVSSAPQAPAKISSGHPASSTPAHPKRVTISAGVAAGLLIQKTTPMYPPIARAARVSGTVVLQAVISTTGSVKDLRVISGPAMLQQAALDAVKTWRYQSYLLNNQPVEFETTINVIFTLGG